MKVPEVDVGTYEKPVIEEIQNPHAQGFCREMWGEGST